MNSMTKFDAEQFGRDYGAAWSAENDQLLRKAFADDGVYVDGGMDQTSEGIERIAWFHGHMLRFSHDSLIEFSLPIVDGSRFAMEWTWSGTASGKLAVDGNLYAATGRPYAVPGMCVGELDADGPVTYHKDYYDARDFLRQIAVDLAHPIRSSSI